MKRRSCFIFILHVILICFTSSYIVVPEDNNNKNNEDDGFVQFIKPEQDGIIVETNSSTSFVISSNSKIVVALYKVCFSLKITHEDDVNQHFQSEIECKEFNSPGSAVVFPSFTNHKVNKLKSGSRHTLAIWMTGPKFR